MSSLKPVFVVALVLTLILAATGILQYLRRPDIAANQAIVTTAPTSDIPLPTTTLLTLGGPAYVSFDGQVWSTVDTQAFVIAGQSIKTSGQSPAVIIYSDGSQTRLSPGSQVHLDSLDITPDQAHIRLSQSAGQTWHHLAPHITKLNFTLIAASVSAQVTTPTSFSAVLDANELNLAVFSGSLLVTSQQQPPLELSAHHQLQLSLLPTATLPQPTSTASLQPDTWWQQNTSLDQNPSLISLDQLSLDKVAAATQTFYQDWAAAQATASAATP